MGLRVEHLDTDVIRSCIQVLLHTLGHGFSVAPCDLERHLLPASELPSTSALLITNLMQEPVEIAANDGDIGVVVAKSGLGNLDGPLQLGAGAVQVAQAGRPADGRGCCARWPVPADGSVAVDLEVGPAELAFDLLVALLDPVPQPYRCTTWASFRLPGAAAGGWGGGSAF
jgi:hypothetical protein